MVVKALGSPNASTANVMALVSTSVVFSLAFGMAFLGEVPAGPQLARTTAVINIKEVRIMKLDSGMMKTIRQKVFAFFPRGSSIEKLYAASISAQIFRYLHEFEERVLEYQTFSGSIRLQGVRFTKLPFLVVPEEYVKELSTALEVLKENRVISSFNLNSASRLVIAEFAYP